MVVPAQEPRSSPRELLEESSTKNCCKEEEEEEGGGGREPSSRTEDTPARDVMEQRRKEKAEGSNDYFKKGMIQEGTGGDFL